MTGLFQVGLARVQDVKGEVGGGCVTWVQFGAAMSVAVGRTSLDYAPSRRIDGADTMSKVAGAGTRT